MTLYHTCYSAGINGHSPQRTTVRQDPNVFHPCVTTPYSDHCKMTDQWVTCSPPCPGASRPPLLIIPPTLSEMIEEYFAKRKFRCQKVEKEILSGQQP